MVAHSAGARGTAPQRPSATSVDAVLPRGLPWATQWRILVDAARAAIPQDLSLILYGSRVSGYARDDSDYDLLAVVSNKALLNSRKALADEIQGATGLPVDLNLGTLTGLKTRSLLDPYVQYTVATGVQVPPGRIRLSPLSRQGIEDALICVELDIDDIREADPAQVTQPMVLHVAKQLAVLSQALDSRYSAQAYGRMVWEGVRLPIQQAVCIMVQRVEEIRQRLAQVSANPGDAALVQYVGRERQQRHEQAH